MSFGSILRQIVDECGGGIGAALMGSDGIAIAQVLGRGQQEEVEEQLTALGVEFGRILDEMRKAADSTEAGGLEEVTVRLDKVCLVLRGVDTETFLVIALKPEGNLGKARFLARCHLHALREEL